MYRVVVAAVEGRFGEQLEDLLSFGHKIQVDRDFERDAYKKFRQLVIQNPEPEVIFIGGKRLWDKYWDYHLSASDTDRLVSEVPNKAKYKNLTEFDSRGGLKPGDYIIVLHHTVGGWFVKAGRRLE